ncbi:MAG: carbamoyl-phosphate synthase large subunit [Elusimicrobiota bacterium]|jgi:carbamoyl-phosphate synthase large subunit
MSPRRNDIKKILVLGSGPIVIGQACEFDYSGTQALKALKAEGYDVVLVNSNPATIMTDPALADRTYLEPLTPDCVEQILERERPQAILPTLGGQTALNLAVSLAERGTLKRLGVELLGADLEVIRRAEDRELFKKTMKDIGLAVPNSLVVTELGQVREAGARLGFPVVVRPSFTLGGNGGGIAHDPRELLARVAAAFDASPSRKVLLEESVLGWKEYELEVMRDRKDNFVVVCSIENIDPMGVHTGDSVTVAPAQTLTDREYQAMREDARRAVSAVGVETGGCNVQFAVEPKTGRRVVIEINPRVSRSSALASKATGFPIAKLAAKLAVGYTLDEVPNDVTKKSCACFEPAVDYVVTKVPRFAFEKFYAKEEDAALLGPSMKSVGEVLALGRTFKESLQKALRSLEAGRDGFQSPVMKSPLSASDRELLIRKISSPCADRLFWMKAALENGIPVQEAAERSGMDAWFLHQMRELIDFEQRLIRQKPSPKILREAKILGFSDRALARLWGKTEDAIRKMRRRSGLRPSFKLVDTCAAEFEAATPYYYSTYHGDNEVRLRRNRRKVAILGSGPNRIGQGIEFDYSCVHASEALREAGFETVMINCNPETVSTDYDVSDRLYFEPLTFEDVTEILHLEKPLGTMVQFGGQTPLNLTLPLHRAGERILGTHPSFIDAAEDRRRFGALIKRLGIPAPAHGIAKSEREALAIARRVGFPVMVRPSYVLGGRAMEVASDEEALRDYLVRRKHAGHPSLLVDRFLSDAAEADVDAVCDGEDVFIGGVMEHIEEAGIHSGDSACTLPPHSLTPSQIERMLDYTRRLARGLRVVGLLNVQFAVKDDAVYVLEANPRASRTVPFLSKATGIPLAKLAALSMVGRKLKTMLPKPLRGQQIPKLPYAATKEVIFPFNRFPGVDPTLGPEMRSTGEVMGLGPDFARSFAKSQAAAGTPLPVSGAVFISVRDEDKAALVPIAATLGRLGFELHATRGTQSHLARHGVRTSLVRKLGEGRPNPVDLLRQGGVSLIVNTPSSGRARSDGYNIRRTALELGIACVTNINDCRAVVHGISLQKGSKPEVLSLQEYHALLPYSVPR